jgi:hypothetical protein
MAWLVGDIEIELSYVYNDRINQRLQFCISRCKYVTTKRLKLWLPSIEISVDTIMSQNGIEYIQKNKHLGESNSKIFNVDPYEYNNTC